MNPRHRRLLIPGLLIALMVVVVVASLMGRADAADTDTVVLADPRITESSGLAVSSDHPGLAYTVNDSGNASEVFAIDLASGDVVGVTQVRSSFRDVEALALRDGTLWIADVGDNQAQRDDTALYAIDEPGRESKQVDARRFPVALATGPADVEALLAQPGSDRLFLVTKTLAAAEVFSVAESELDPGRVTTFESVGAGLPPLVTDGSFSPGGTKVALLSYGSVATIDPADWSVVGQQDLPVVNQTETIAFTSEDAVLVGSEGTDSQLIRLVLQSASAAVAPSGPATVATDAARPAAVDAKTSAHGVEAAMELRPVALAAVGVLVVVGLGTVMTMRQRGRSNRSSRAIR